MKTYMNKKTLAIVTLIAQVDNRYTVEYEDGTQKSYAESSFKKMFKFVEDVDDNADTNVDDEYEEVTATEAEEPVQITLDDAVITTEPDENEKVYTDEPISVKPKKSTSKKAKKTKKDVEVCVEMRAFTGMRIGKFKATKTKTGYSVYTKEKGMLHFNLEGHQTDSPNPKFASNIKEVRV